MPSKRMLVSSTLAVAFLAAGDAHAHPRLIDSTPRANSRVSAASRVSLTFNERLLAPMSGGDIVMNALPGGVRQPSTKLPSFTSSVGPDGRTLVFVGARPLAKGRYLVKWHAVAADTHRVAGSLAFQVD